MTRVSGDRNFPNVMKANRVGFAAALAGLLLLGTAAQAATLKGTVTNKTTGKPSSGDTVVLIDVQAGMGEVAHATSDAKGQYTLTEPGAGPYLVRVTHQGAPYFIAAPQSGGPGDVAVFDVATKVEGVFIEADVFELEAANDQLRVVERFFVHNTSTPPRTEWSPKTFEVVLPAEATVTSTSAQRPTGLPTSIKLDPAETKGHFTFNFPIEPDDGDKDTLFQIEYTVPYTAGKFTFHPAVTLATQSVGVLLPKSMTFAAGGGAMFQPLQQDPNIQTFVAKNAVPGKPLEFTVSGTGSMPRETQGAPGGATGAAGGQPGGGIGEPINTPDPLSKYKWWILGGLALVLAAAAAFLLRKPVGAPATATAAAATPAAYPASQPQVAAAPTTAAGKNAALLAALKEELFALESEKISGTITAEEYAEVKPALETVLKRALKRNK